jgi:multidrug efflux pump subunit AcrB
MWIVRLALRRPYTFVVMAMLLVLGGIFAITKMPTDIFPEIDIPVVAVIWQYGGLPAEEMERRVTTNYERAITTTVSGVEHIESQTLAGYGIVKVFFHPGTRIEAATAQITAISQTVVRQFPPGMTPPLIMQYSASNVPILQGAVRSDTLPEQALFDLTNTGLRTGLATVQGAQMPFPYGGKMRQIMVDIDLARLHALGLGPNDVASAISLQNLILPSGTVKLGAQEMGVRLNSSPETLRELSAIPIATVRGATVTIGDVAQVRDGFAPQTNMVRNNGRNGVLLSILKSGGASTLDIVRRIRNTLPEVMPTLPPEYHLDLLFDQSIFVRAAVDGVVKEGLTAAALTAVMILLFLGSWRSTLIVLVSIPLSILASVIALASLGQTLNLMTLGGLSLAVGILVDDATVEIENVHRNIAMRKPLVRAILDGAQQIATPAFVATLSICIVFVPVVFITGAARSLFTPLAMAVVFAMMTSYLLSRTLVPTMMQHLLGAELHRYTGDRSSRREDLAWRAHLRFNRLFERLRRLYGGYLDVALDRRGLVFLGFGAFVIASGLALYPHLGRDFFPAVDAGQIRMHVRCPPGMRLEETAQQFSRVEEEIRRVIPREEIVTLLDNIGIPNSGINLALGDPSMISAADGEIMVALDPHHHGPTAGYVKTLRERFAERFPTFEIFFLAPDITTQVLNFGLSAPIDLQVTGPPGNRAQNLLLARRLRDQLARVPGAVDVHLQQALGAPALRVNVDRVEASQQGLTERDVANSLLVSLSSNSAVAPSFWLDPRRGVQYQVAVQTPQYRVDSLDALRNTPVVGPAGVAQTLGNLATVERDAQPVNITHYNVAPTFDVLASVQGTDLGSVADAVDRILARERRHLPRGTTITVRGQVESMASSFRGLAYGIIFAIVLVYLLLVVNFQSWLDPVIILAALPGALAGICWMLFASHTTLSVPALMGAIMSIGVATSNSILMVTFANDKRAEGADARRAAWLAGITRLRPVLMTALAMVLGMLPMSLGMGEGGEQNAPLGRAVIGGLLLATVATLFFVPVVYSALRRAPPKAPMAELET